MEQVEESYINVLMGFREYLTLVGYQKS